MSKKKIEKRRKRRGGGKLYQVGANRKKNVERLYVNNEFLSFINIERQENFIR